MHASDVHIGVEVVCICYAIYYLFAVPSMCGQNDCSGHAQATMYEVVSPQDQVRGVSEFT